MKRFSGLAVPAATFGFSAMLAFAVHPAMGLFGLLTPGGTTGGQKPCEIRIFRDEPYFTKVLDDWPLQGTCPRSPKYVFGKDRPITVEVRLEGTAHAKVVVQVTNKDLTAPGPKTIDIECDHVGDGIYRSRITGKDEILYLADHTEERSNGDLIHVREEEVLEFVLKEPSDPNCKIDVMVDRGEGAATTVPEPKAAMRAGFDGAALQFIQGVQGFDPDTTGWWNNGQWFGNAAFSTFLLDVGAEDTNENALPSWEADLLFLGAHGDTLGELGPEVGASLFAPDSASIFMKSSAPGPPRRINPADDPQFFYFDPRVNNGIDTFGTNGKHWDTDIDWALSYSCNTLISLIYPVGQEVPDARGNLVFRQDPVPDAARTAADRWKNAFSGARRLHGFLSYTTTGSNADIIVNVVPRWLALLKAGTSIPKAWCVAVAEMDPDKGAAILYIERNWNDTIDTMQRDPCAGEVPIYWASGMGGGGKKKGKIPATKPLSQGKLPAKGAELTSRPVLGLTPPPPEPRATLLDGACLVFVPYPNEPGKFTRLRLTRSESPAPGSVFTPDDQGLFRFDSGASFGALVPNAVSPASAEAGLRTFLANNFTTLPSLATQGVFEGAGVALDGASSPVATRFEIVLEQRHRGLTVFDSNIYASLSPLGDVEAASAIFYDILTHGPAADILSGRQATEIAALDFLSRFPGRPCEVTLIVPFYGEPAEVAPGVKEVRPVWGIQFAKGEFVATLDAVTGAILRVEGR